MQVWATGGCGDARREESREEDSEYKEDNKRRGTPQEIRENYKRFKSKNDYFK